MAASGIEESDLRKLTVVKLRERLSSFGLPTSGLKADLVERLHKYYKDQQEQEQEDDFQQQEHVDQNDGPHGAPPSLLSLPVHEPKRHAPPSEESAVLGPPKHATRTALQMRLQAMAGHAQDADKSDKKAPSQPSPSASGPSPLMTMPLAPPHQQPGPPPIQQPPAIRPPPQQMVQPPQGMGAPPQIGQPPQQLGQPPQQIGQPPQQMGQPPQQMGQPPQQMGQPPQQMGQPPQQTSQPPQQMGQPPQPMGQPPQPMGQPPQQMGQPQQQMGQPPQPMGQPPQPMGQPPQQMGQPPQQMGQPPQPMLQQSMVAPGGQPQQLGPPQGQMAPPPLLGKPTSQPPPLLSQPSSQPPPLLSQPSSQPPPLMSQPTSQPPSLLPPAQGSQGGDMQEKVAMQTRMLEQQQQQERLAIQQQALLLQQQQLKQEAGEEGGDLMEKVRQQQRMLEQQQHKEMQQKQDEDRRRGGPEMVRHQQFRDDHNKRRGGGQSFNPNPSTLQGTRPRPLLPPPSSTSAGIPPLLPPHTSNSGIPPLLPERSERGGGPPQEAREQKLHSALEKVLAFKDVRAQEVGLTQEEIEELNMPEKKGGDEDDEIEMVEMEEEERDDDVDAPIAPASTSESKNKKRKKKKKKSRKNRLEQQQADRPVPSQSEEPEVSVEYVQEQLELDPTDPNYFTFSKIFEAFKITEEGAKDQAKVAEAQPEKAPAAKQKTHDPDEDSDEDMDEKPEDDTPKLSKKKLKKLTRLSVAQLKQLVTRPDVVEMHDVTAQDPLLLVHLKATRNSVPVPRHWCFKRKYLQGKRGIEKAPFELPEYIQATGITEMRAALAEKEDAKNLKSKMREKVRPKMGKIDIDYQKLHDAFFRWQTKPKMTIHGDLYYEGKEFETRLKEKKPGNLSDDLKTALGMPIGPQSEKVPPPWLIAMQRYGPPPSYPNLKIPGLNNPIPEACSFGYHAGGWGKPPVDANGKPLYGDVFGTKSSEFEAQAREDDIDHARWGELESESESEEESESESEEEGPDDTGLITPAEGLVTPSGITSVPVGMETPDMIELRKRRIEDSMDQGGETPALYQVIPEKKTSVGGAMMGSAHIYDVSSLPAGAKKPGEKVSTEGIEVALNPEELDLDTAAMQAKYDQTLKEQQSQLEKEDLSDMVAEHAAKQKKRKKKQEESGKAAKKYKEFKF